MSSPIRVRDLRNAYVAMPWMYFTGVNILHDRTLLTQNTKHINTTQQNIYVQSLAVF